MSQYSHPSNKSPQSGKICLIMSDERAKAIGKKFLAARNKLGLTQQDVADKAGLNVSHYAKVERGDLKATIETREKIGTVLKLKITDLL